MIESDKELPQQYEQIPWSQLVPVQKDRSLQLAGLVAVIVAALIAILFLLRKAPDAPPIIAATAPPVAAAQAEVEPSSSLLEGVVPSTPAVAPIAVPQPQIYSEADLMAALPPHQDLMAIARAEWFVTDYFTIDGDGDLSEAIAAGLPDAVSLPTTDGAAISYVEWARAVAVADNLDGSYDVTVWFRALVGTAESGFERTDVRAVEVRLATDASGRLAIADLPGVVRLEPAGVAPPWPVPGAAPEDVVAAGAAELAGFGSDPTLETAGLDERGWRLVFTIGDASGLRFPIVVRQAAPGG